MPRLIYIIIWSLNVLTAQNITKYQPDEIQINLQPITQFPFFSSFSLVLFFWNPENDFNKKTLFGEASKQLKNYEKMKTSLRNGTIYYVNWHNTMVDILSPIFGRNHASLLSLKIIFNEFRSNLLEPFQCFFAYSFFLFIFKRQNAHYSMWSAGD